MTLEKHPRTARKHHHKTVALANGPVGPRSPISGIVTAQSEMPIEPNHRSVIDAVNGGILAALQVLVAIALLSEIGVLTVNAGFREIGHESLLWTQDIAQLALPALAFLGGALAYAKGRHPTVTVAVRWLPLRMQGAVNSAARLSVVVTSVIVGVTSITAVRENLTASSVVLHINMAYYVLALPVGMGIIAWFALTEWIRFPGRDVLFGFVIVAVVAVAEVLVEQAWPGLNDVAIIAMLATFVLMIITSVPITFALLMSSVIYLFDSGTGGGVPSVGQNAYNGISNLVLLAVPFFILMGLLLTEGGLNHAMIRLAKLFVGRLRGGLLNVAVVSMFLFSGVSGSKVADVAAVGGAMGDSLDAEGYDREELAAVLNASAVMGETIPPSTVMLVLASITSVSVIDLFLAGTIPAAILALLLIGYIWIRNPKPTNLARLGVREWLRQVLLASLTGVPALIVPAIVVGGIVFGILDPTEAGATAVVAAVVIALAMRRLSLAGAWRAIQGTAELAGFVLIVLASANAFSWVLSVAGLAQSASNLFAHAASARLLFLGATIVVGILLGAILEGLPAILILGPILIPIAPTIGVSPLQISVVLLISQGLGCFCPPIGVGSQSVAAICRTTMEGITRRGFRYLAVIAIGIVIIAAVPGFSTWLPNAVNIR